MSFSLQPRSPEMPSTEKSPDYIDIKEFSTRCEIYKNEIKQNKGNISTLDSNFGSDSEEVSSSPLVSPSLITKWQNIFEQYSYNLEDVNLKEIIASEDASLNTEASKKEVELARRIARCKLFSAETVGCESLNHKCTKTIGSTPPGLNNSAMPLPGNVLEADFKSFPVSSSDVILTFSIFPGGKSSSFQSYHRQEIEIKATYTLETFTQGIYCLSRRIAKEMITDSCQCAIISSSSFLFIEGTFYDEELDEMTHSRPSDIYYESFKAVGKSSTTAHLLYKDPSSVKQASLKSTRWIDLKIKLNTPYLFAHLGGCEHVFFITKIRAAGASEENTLLLPRVSQALRVRRRKCRICEVYAGSKMLINDKLLPENPCIVCDKCYEGFHGEDQNWYNDFDVVPYYHEA